MRLKIAFTCWLLALCAIPNSSKAQYFLKPDANANATGFPQLTAAGAQFDIKEKHDRKVEDNQLSFVPTKPKSAKTLQEMENGLLLGEFTSDKTWSLGTSRLQKLPPGTYQMWLVRQKRIWMVVATDQNGVMKATTNEVTLHIDKGEAGKFFGSIKPDFMVPPYAMTDENGRVHQLPMRLLAPYMVAGAGLCGQQ